MRPRENKKDVAITDIFLSDLEKLRRRLGPRELFTDCETRENEIVKHPPSLDRLLRSLLFNGRLFCDQPMGGLRIPSDPFHVIVAPGKRLRTSLHEWRYRKVLELLRKQPDRELRWLLISKWLKQEGVCQPEELLPPEVQESLLARYHRHLPLSATDLYHRALIRNWLTYFERIQAELIAKRHVQRSKEEVVKLGYDSRAVTLMARGRSTVVSAICQWLYGRRKGDARKLRNSYSRLHSHLEKRAGEFEREMSSTVTQGTHSKK
jgi:hypothetical protein